MIRSSQRAAWMLVALWTVTAYAQGLELRPVEDPASQDTPAETAAPPKPPTLNDLIKQVLIEAVGDEYVDTKNWDKQRDRFDGFKVRGLKISKRKKAVNHGLWQKYKVALIRPEETLQIEVKQLPSRPNSNSVPFQISLRMRAHTEATVVNWVWGVKGVNGTSVADATIQVRILLDVTPETQFSLTNPLKFTLTPKVNDVDLWLLDLDLKRIGVFREVEFLGDGMRKAIEAMMETQEKKIRQKLQKKLDEVA